MPTSFAAHCRHASSSASCCSGVCSLAGKTTMPSFCFASFIVICGAAVLGAAAGGDVVAGGVCACGWLFAGGADVCAATPPACSVIAITVVRMPASPASNHLMVRMQIPSLRAFDAEDGLSECLGTVSRGSLLEVNSTRWEAEHRASAR